MKVALIILTLALCLVGCNSPNSTTDLREYFVDGLHVIVGVKQTTNDKITIKSYDGAVWDIPKGTTIKESPVTLESFRRVTE